MSKFKNWFLIFSGVFVAFLATMTKLAHPFVFGESPTPSSVRISLAELGIVADLKFEVRRQYSYVYFMRFAFPENDQAERARVRKLLGGHAIDKSGKPLEPGTPTPIQLRIFEVCADGKEVEVYSQSRDPILTSWGEGHFTKMIDTHVMSPGFYRAHIVNKRASPEFSSIPITFEIGMPAKVNFDATKVSTGSQSCQK